MEQYRQITFLEAMKMVNEARLDKLYFETSGGIYNVKQWKLSISNLTKEKWFIKEQI